jgi:peptidoglycan/LPS O-acetylase OafA/YrhL
VVLTARARGGARAQTAQPQAGRTPAAERGFRPDVQGLRAVAVSLVVIYHLFPTALPGGYVGVDVFFVISGFLITGHIARGFARTGRVSLLDFYGRRARRLLPAAALVLTVTWLVSLVTLPLTQLPATAQQVRASALYYQNWILAHDAVDYLKSDQAATPVQHFWSLSVEEQFYLVWPVLFLLAGLVAYLVARRTGAEDAPARVGRPVMFGLALTVVAVSLGYSAYFSYADPQAAYLVTTTRMWELGVGGALALLARPAAAWLGRFGPLAWLGLAMVIVSGFVIKGTAHFPGTIALLPVGGAALLIACGSAAARFGPAALTSTRPMVFIGDVSYSVYLWHFPIILLWQAWYGPHISLGVGVLMAAAAVLLAWLTKIFVEDKVRLSPFIAQHKGRSLATALTVVVPVTLVSVWLAQQPGPFDGKLDAAHPGAGALAHPDRTVASAAAVPPLVQAATDYELASTDACQATISATTPVHCTFGDTTNPRLTVALVGDSVAGQWSSALDAIGKAQHWKIVTDTHSSCPWTAVMTNFRGHAGQFSACHTWGQAVLSDLENTIKPDVVITSDRPNVGVPSHRKPDAISRTAIGRGMATYWRQLRAHGITVVAIQESPEMGKDIPDCLSARRHRVCSTPASSAIIDPAPTQAAVAAMRGQATLVDMNPLICGRTTCSPIVGNVIVYRDAHHLTDAYTLSLVPYLQQKLLAVPALAR